MVRYSQCRIAHPRSLVVLGVALVTTIARYSLALILSEASTSTALYARCTYSILQVFYKNELSVSTTYLNLYMIFGGTNWGGIAYPEGYTSYDYVRTFKFWLATLRFGPYPHSRAPQSPKTVHFAKSTMNSSYKPTSSASARPISRRVR